MDEHNFEWISGDYEELSFSFQNDDGSTRDISGWTIYFTVKKNRRDSDSEAVISVDHSNHTDSTNGRTTITISSETTREMDGYYAYDVVYEKPDGSTKTFLQGSITVRGDITQRT